MSYDEYLTEVFIEKIEEFLNTFENTNQSLSQIKKEEMYLFGKSGIGKTTFIKNVLKR